MADDKVVKVRLIAVADQYVKGTTEASTVTRKLGSDAEASGSKATQAFSKMGTATGSVAASLRKLETAQGSLRLAEMRLNDARAKGVTGTRLASAEEAVARARRGVVTATEAHTRALKADSEAADKAIDKNRGLTDSLKGMKTVAAGFAGMALVSFLRDSVAAAGDLEQSIGGVDTVFGDAAQKVHDFGESAAQNVGLSTNAFNELITVTGAMLKNKGLEDFADKSLQLVQIGADLSATYGGSAKEAVEALNAAMRGESDPIERYGISLNETAVNAELAKKGLDKLTGAALDQATAQARIDIITRQSADAMGAFAREADTLQGQQQRLTAEWENAKASLGQALLPALTNTVSALRGGLDVVTAAVGAWEKIPGPIKAAAAALVLYRIAQGPLERGGKAVADTVRSLGEALSYASQSAQRAGGGFAGFSAGFKTFTGSSGLASAAVGGLKSAMGGLLGAFGGPIGLAITGITAALGGWIQAQQNAKRAAEELAGTLDKQTGAFTQQTRDTFLSKFFGDFSQGDYAKIKDSLDAAGVGVADLIAAYQRGGPAIDEFKRKFDAWQAAAIASGDTDLGGNADKLGNAYQALSRDMAGATVIAEENRSAQQKVSTAVGETADAAEAAAPAIADVTAQQTALQKAAQTAADANKDLAKAMNDIIDAAVGADEAAINYQKALDDANASLKENGATLNINSDAGRKNKESLINLAQAARDAAEANLKNGDSTSKVKDKMADARAEFVRIADKMGISRAEAEKLATKYGVTRDSVDKLKAAMDKVPKEVKSDLKVNADNALREVAALRRALALLKDKSIDITTRYKTEYDTSYQAAKNRSAIEDLRRASGGPVYGKGTATSDSIPAYLSNGEYVIKAAAVAKYGTPLFDRLNSMHFASGGYVSRGVPGPAGAALTADQIVQAFAQAGVGDNFNIAVADPIAAARAVAREKEWALRSAAR